MKKRLLSIVLSLTMVLTMLPTTIFAASKYTQADIINGKWLTWDVIDANNISINEVTSNLALIDEDVKPDESIYDSGSYQGAAAKVTWTSSNTQVINVSGTTGVVTRPTIEDGDIEVVLTAKIEKGDIFDTITNLAFGFEVGEDMPESQTSEKSFTVNVLAEVDDLTVVPNTIDVILTAQKNIQGDNEFIIQQEEVDVSSDLAESYGYKDEVEAGKVSALDVLVRAHEINYGADFNSTSCFDYLDTTGSKLVFGIDSNTANSGFIVNGVIANDGIYNDLYGGYTQYMVNQAPISDGDTVDFYYYGPNYSEQAVTFYEDGLLIKEVEAEAKSEFDITVKSYRIIYDGTNDNIESVKGTVEGAEICAIDTDGSLEKDCLAITNKDGIATMTFDEPGEYYLVARNETQDIVSSILKVTVEPTYKSEYTQADIINGKWLTWDTINDDDIEQDAITRNLKLVESDTIPNQDEYSTTYYGMCADVSWTSSDTSIIATDGTVTRPVYGEENVDITLTATIEKGINWGKPNTNLPATIGEDMPIDEVGTKRFDVTVLAQTEPDIVEPTYADQELVDGALKLFSLDNVIMRDSGEIADLMNLTYHINDIPYNYSYIDDLDGCIKEYETITYTWTSTGDGLGQGLSLGTINRSDIDQEGEITLTLTLNDAIATKSWPYKVPAFTQAEVTAETNAMNDVAASLDFEDIKLNNIDQNAVSSNLFAIQNGKYVDGVIVLDDATTYHELGSNITWTSSDSSIISDTPSMDMTTYDDVLKVTQPSVDTEVTLIATLKSPRFPDLVTPVTKEIKVVVTGTGEDTEPATPIKVTYTYAKDSSLVITPEELEVTAGLSTTYGLTEASSDNADPTVLDAIVAAHIQKYGDEFTKINAGNYIDSTLSKIFGDSGFTGHYINKEYSEEYATHAVIKDNDIVDTFLYCPDWNDTYVAFFKDNTIINELEVEAGTEVELTITGGSKITSIEGLEIGALVGGEFTKISQTNSSSNVTVSFDKPGTYLLVSNGTATVTGENFYGEVGITEDNSIIPAWCKVTVTDVQIDAETDTFKIPQGADLYIGHFAKAQYAPYISDVDYMDKTVTADGTTTITYNLPTDSKVEYIYIVSKNGEMQYANTFTKKSDDAIVKDLSNVFDNPYNENSIIRDIKNQESNILLNINKTHQKDMEVNDTFQIIPMRISQGYLNAFKYDFLSPGFDYEVTILEGTDPITISEDGVITANEEGTAIVTVTYNSLQAYDKYFSAIYPENTGAFVVRVGSDLGNVETNIDLDAELDVLYYVGNDVIYNVEVADGTTVSYINPRIGQETVTYSTTFTEATVSDDGVTKLVLTEGRNIIKFVSGDDTTYQVVTAKPIDITVMGEDNVLISDTNKAGKGEELTVTISGLTEPAPKLSRIYNFNSGVRFEGSDGKLYGKGAKSQGFGNYTFLTTGGTFKFNIPENFNEDSFDFKNGDIGVYGFGGKPGTHREITIDGLTSSYASSIADYFGILPDFSIPVDVKVVAPKLIDVKFSVFDGEKFIAIDNTIISEISTYPGLTLDKGFDDVKIDEDYDSILDDVYAFETALKLGEVTYFDAMLGWQIAIDELAEADITKLKEYIDFTQSSYGGAYVTAFNGLQTSDLNFMVNGTSIQNGVASKYVKSGDHITVSLWKDTDYTNNVTPNYTKGGEVVNSITLTEDKPDTVTLEYGYYDSEDDYAYKTAVLQNAQLAVVNIKTGELTPINNAITNEKGEVSLTFNKEGEYIIAPISGEGQDIYPTLLNVKVNKKATGSGGSTSEPSDDKVTVKIYGVSSSVKEGEAIYKTNKSSFSLWINEEVSIKDDYSVWDAAKLALEESGLSYDNFDDSYVSSINGLAELDRGPNSGWLYEVNGEYPSGSINDEKVYDSDVITLHYTDNYAKEDSYTGTGSGPDTDAGLGGGSGGDLDTDTEGDTDPTLPTTGTSDANAKVFDDVTSDSWFYSSVDYVIKNKLFVGVSEKEFAPNNNMTRAMVMTVLHRLSGDESFEPTDTWYGASMNWAKSEGISDGTLPNQNVTREQLITMLYRYANAESIEADLSRFDDMNEISNWAQDAFYWAVSKGIIAGKTDSTLDPKGNATRAEVAAMIMRFDDIILK